MTDADAKSLEWISLQACGFPLARHPHLCLYDLSPELQVVLGAHVIHMLSNPRRSPSLTDDEVYLGALWHFGVDCPHPHRLFAGTQIEIRHALPAFVAFDCLTCGMRVMPLCPDAAMET